MRNIVTQPRVLAKVPSKSNPNKSYEIRLGGDGVVYCTCRAWITNKFCKHLEEYHSKNAGIPTQIMPSTGRNNAVLRFFETQAAQSLTKVADAAEQGESKIYNTVKFGIIEGRWS